MRLTLVTNGYSSYNLCRVCIRLKSTEKLLVMRERTNECNDCLYGEKSLPQKVASTAAGQGPLVDPRILGWPVPDTDSDLKSGSADIRG